MKILVLLTDAFGGQGGIALYNRDLLTALCNHPDCQEVVAIPRLMPNPLENVPDKLTYNIKGIGSKLRYISTVFKTVRRQKPFDLIVCSHINLLPIAYLIKAWISAPLLLETYGIDVWQPKKSWLINHLVNKIDAAISISNITRKRFLRWTHLTENQIYLLPNAIHTELYGMAPKSSQLVDLYDLKGKKVLMTLGRMAACEQYKGFDEVIEILPDLTKSQPDIVYLAVGDGDDRQRLASKAEELGVANYVILTSFVDEEEKADHYRLADVYIMPSRGEGFGFVILEALACGVPVIASESDGTREAVRNGELGQLVDPGKPEQIKSAVLRALQMPKEVPECLEYFSFDRFSQRLHKIVGLITESKL